jgi:hypothetical protein
VTLTTLETHGFVGADNDDLPWATKLADNLSIRVRIRYANDAGAYSERTIEIDGVFGSDLDNILYLRAFDGLSGERRTFRVDRILEVTTRTGWSRDCGAALSKAVRVAAGLAQERPNLDARVALKVLIEDQDEAGALRRMEGIFERLTVRFDEHGVTAIVVASLRIAGTEDDLKKARYVIEPPGTMKREIVAIFDGETGEYIDDLYAWASAAAGLGTEGLGA